MSFNDLIENVNIDLEKELLSSKEEKDFEKSFYEKISLKEYEKKLNQKLVEIDRLKQLDSSYLLNLKEVIDFKLRKVSTLKKNLESLTVDYINKLQEQKFKVESKQKELNQKLSILNGFEEDIKFYFEEKFHNNFYIKTSTVNKLYIHNEENKVTLPIESKEELVFSELEVNKNNNIIAGNISTGKQKLLLNLIDNNPDTYFEAYKEEIGPLVMDLKCKFKKESVVNEINIECFLQNGVDEVFIEDIRYVQENGNTLSIKNLLDTNYESFVIKGSMNKGKKTFVHLPVKATQVVISFKVKEYVVRENKKIFSIAIKNISASSVKYKEEGVLESTEITIPENIYKGKTSLKVFPKNGTGHKSLIKLSEDSNFTFEDNENEVLLNGEKKSIGYKLNTKRGNLNSISLNENKFFFIDTDNKTRLYSKKVSPITYSLENQKNLKVYLPEVINRSSDIEKSIKVGSISNEGINEVLLPIGLKNLKISKKEITVYMNNSEWELVKSKEQLENGKFYIDDKLEKIIFKLNSSGYLYSCKINLKPTFNKIIKRQEGYFVEINEEFDKDLKTIKVFNLIKSLNKKTEFLEVGESEYFLEEEYIDLNETKLFVKRSSGWEEAEIKDIEVTTGRLYWEEDKNLERKIEYGFYKYAELKNKKLWSNKNKDYGIFLKEEDLVTEEIQENLFDTNSSMFIFEDKYLERKIVSENNKVFLLKEGNIIKGSLEVDNSLFEGESFKEVDYINGNLEFLSLEKMDKDIVPNISKSTSNTVSFTLSEIPYTEDGLNIKVYKKGVLVNNNIRIDGRVCELEIEENTGKDYYLEYYYEKTEKEDLNKFSVDYRNGILFCSKEIVKDENKKISYDIGRVGVEYSLIKEIQDFELLNEEIKVYTENLPTYKNQIKFCWEKIKDEISLEDIREYFSPIIYSIKLEMK